MPRIATTPKCSACGGTCMWADDWWVCTKCGSEWNEDFNPRYAPPGSEVPESTNPPLDKHG